MGKNESADKKCRFHKFKQQTPGWKSLDVLKVINLLPESDAHWTWKQLMVSLVVKEKNKIKENR